MCELIGLNFVGGPRPRVLVVPTAPFDASAFGLEAFGLVVLAAAADDPVNIVLYHAYQSPPQYSTDSNLQSLVMRNSSNNKKYVLKTR